ncbi:hypothetical protein THC_0430 [Caldimicrobium thiodismutans]|jgi:ABC-type transport system involved in cytochrome c biogenesis permease component|uniref:Uncharacterized protein n=1 Tax=Caldimicrobium thiodismutans TaxID=1653476 RepID=A0A0U5AYK9_9BACT|nr:hypothetical protein [Caldimicrobium thiodismutans]BAU22825.1 hypothetical protein THC_0430 [Caldimicrobium thiodismutans]
MKKIKRSIPLILWIIALLTLFLGASQGFNFIQSRGSILCLSCMGLEENEDF